MSDIKKDKNSQISKRTDSNLVSNFNGFFKNEHHSFVVLKTEKLASALYMVSGFVSEKDPLRSRLRTCALDLMSCVADSKRGGNVGNKETFSATCLEIGTMLGVAEKAGFISPMNSKILSEEYAGLASFVYTHYDQVFDTCSVDVSEEAPQNIYSRLGLNKGQTTLSTSPKKPVPKKTPNSKRHQNRRDIILSLLNKKDKINVKDASSAIEGCSEKTIQRELTAMVAEGVLLKEGERRWSTYRKA